MWRRRLRHQSRKTSFASPSDDKGGVRTSIYRSACAKERGGAGNDQLSPPEKLPVGTVVGSQTSQQDAGCTPQLGRTSAHSARRAAQPLHPESANTLSGRHGRLQRQWRHSCQNNFILAASTTKPFGKCPGGSTEASHPSVKSARNSMSSTIFRTRPEYGRSNGAVVSVNTRSG